MKKYHHGVTRSTTEEEELRYKNLKTPWNSVYSVVKILKFKKAVTGTKARPDCLVVVHAMRLTKQYYFLLEEV